VKLFSNQIIGGTKEFIEHIIGNLNGNAQTASRFLNDGLISQYYRGDQEWTTLDTNAVTEADNLYFTIERSRDSITGGLVILYDNITGVISHIDSETIRHVTDIQVTYWNSKSDGNHNHDDLYEPKNSNIQQHILNTSNPHNVTKTQVGLSNVLNIDTSTTANINDTTTKRFVTDTQIGVWNAKQDFIVAGTTSQYRRGDNSWQTLNTTVVTEGTNLYHTTQRARDSVSGSGVIGYNPSTGVISHTDSSSVRHVTDAQINAWTAASSVSITATSPIVYNSGNISHVDTASIRHVTDTEKATWNAKQDFIVAGTTSQYRRGDNSWQTLNTTVVTEGTSLYFTTQRARDSVSGSGVIGYNSSSGVISHTDSSSVRHVTDAEKDIWNTVTDKADANNVVTIDTPQTVTGAKIFTQEIEATSFKTGSVISKYNSETETLDFIFN